LDLGPERQGAKVIYGGAPFPPLRCPGLSLSMAPSLNGVAHIVVIADPVARRWMARGKLVPRSC
jgi:hypothetical protein